MVSAYDINPAYSWPGIRIGLPDVSGSLKRALDFLIFSSVFMGLQGVGMVYVSYLVQGLVPSAAVLAIMFLTPFSVYNMNRKTDEEEDSVNHPDRFRFTKRFEQQLAHGALVAYVLAAVIAVEYGPLAVAVTLVPLIAGILYSMPLLPKWCGYRRLKEIPVMKNIVVCSSWSTIAVFLPVVTAGASVTLATLLCLVVLASWGFHASALPDMRDVKGDALSGVRTIPVLIGIEKTRTLLGIMNGVTTLVVLVVGIIAALPAVTAGLLLGALAYFQGCIGSFGRVGNTGFICDVVMDGAFVIVGGAVFLLQVIAPLLI